MTSRRESDSFGYVYKNSNNKKDKKINVFIFSFLIPNSGQSNLFCDVIVVPQQPAVMSHSMKVSGFS